MKRRKLMNGIKYIVLIVLACIYLIPIIMMLLGSVKDPAQAMLFDLSWPETFHWDNYSYVIEEGNILNGVYKANGKEKYINDIDLNIIEEKEMLETIEKYLNVEMPE